MKLAVTLMLPVTFVSVRELVRASPTVGGTGVCARAAGAAQSNARSTSGAASGENQNRDSAREQKRWGTAVLRAGHRDSLPA